MRDKIFDAVQDVRLCAVVHLGVVVVLRVVEAEKKGLDQGPSNKLGGVEPKFSTRSGSDGGIALEGARSCLVQNVTSI